MVITLFREVVVILLDPSVGRGEPFEVQVPQHMLRGGAQNPPRQLTHRVVPLTQVDVRRPAQHRRQEDTSGYFDNSRSG